MERSVQVVSRRGAWIIRLEGDRESLHHSSEDALTSARSLLERTGGLIIVHDASGAIVDRVRVEPLIVHRMLVRA